jgi:hypothetical protein
MDIESAQRNFDAQLSELIERCKAAKENALTKPEIEELLHEKQDLMGRAIKKEITPTDYRHQATEIDKKIGAVKFDSIMQFTRALHALKFPREMIESYAAHENAHANQAQQNGLDVGYEFIFAKDEIDGETVYSFVPAARIRYPADRTSQELVRLDKEITSAPEDPSEFDQRRLREIDEGK